MARPKAEDPKESVTITMPRSSMQIWKVRANAEGMTVARYLSHKLNEQAVRLRDGGQRSPAVAQERRDTDVQTYFKK